MLCGCRNCAAKLFEDFGELAELDDSWFVPSGILRKCVFCVKVTFACFKGTCGPESSNVGAGDVGINAC